MGVNGSIFVVVIIYFLHTYGNRIAAHQKMYMHFFNERNYLVKRFLKLLGLSIHSRFFKKIRIVSKSVIDPNNGEIKLLMTL